MKFRRHREESNLPTLGNTLCVLSVLRVLAVWF